MPGRVTDVDRGRRASGLGDHPRHPLEPLLHRFPPRVEGHVNVENRVLGDGARQCVTAARPLRFVRLAPVRVVPASARHSLVGRDQLAYLFVGELQRLRRRRHRQGEQGKDDREEQPAAPHADREATASAGSGLTHSPLLDGLAAGYPKCSEGVPGRWAPRFPSRLPQSPRRS